MKTEVKTKKQICPLIYNLKELIHDLESDLCWYENAIKDYYNCDTMTYGKLCEFSNKSDELRSIIPKLKSIIGE